VTLENHLNESQTKLQEVADKLNQLDQERQQLLQELLRLDGEVKILMKLIKEQNVGESK